jgi:hypothetical protein
MESIKTRELIEEYGKYNRRLQALLFIDRGKFDVI